MRNAAALNQLEADTRKKVHDIQLQQAIQAQTLKLQRLQRQFDAEQKLKQQLLEQTMATKNNISSLKFLQQKQSLSTLNKLQNQYDAEQAIKHKLRLQELIDDKKNQEIEQENELTNAMNEQLNVTSNMLEKQQIIQDLMCDQEDFEIDAMTEQYKKFKDSMKKQKANLMSEHKNELLTKLKEQQRKINKLTQQQRLKQFEAVLKDQQNNMKSDIMNNESQLQETINLVEKQIKNLHEKEMELEMRGKEILEKNAFEQIAKEAETQLINSERQKYANMRESMLREMQKKEERLRERHEAIMNKLIKEREKQLVNMGNDIKRDVYNDHIVDLEKEYEAKKAELAALKQSYNKKQDEIRNQLIQQTNVTNVSIIDNL